MSVTASTNRMTGGTLPGNGRFAAYATYLPSGVDWLPLIPDGWSIKKL